MKVEQNEFETIAFGTLSDLRRLTGIPRSTAYTLIDEGLLQSRYIRGRRFIDFSSVRKLFADAPKTPSPKRTREMTRRGLASAEKRAAKKNGGSTS